MINSINISAVKGVLFDLGGTLIKYQNDPDSSTYDNFAGRISQDEKQITYDEFVLMIDRYWVEMQDEFYKAPSGFQISEFNIRFFKRVGFSDQFSHELASDWSEIIYQLEVDGTSAFDGATELLDYLSTSGYKLGVVSNASHSLERMRNLMEVCGLNKYFNVVVVSSETGFTKPDPRIMQIALDELGLNPSETLFIGDSLEYDGKSSENVGMQFLLVGEHFRLRQVMELFTCKS